MRRLTRVAAFVAAGVVALSTSTSGGPILAAGPALRYLARPPDTLDPAFIADAADVQLLLQLYAGLTRLDETGEPYPSLASGWEISDDGLTYRFVIRDARVQRRRSARRRRHPSLVAATAGSGRRGHGARRAQHRVGGGGATGGRRRGGRGRNRGAGRHDADRHPPASGLLLPRHRRHPGDLRGAREGRRHADLADRRLVRRQRPVRGRRERGPRPRAARQRALRCRPAADRRDPMGGQPRGRHGRRVRQRRGGPRPGGRLGRHLDRVRQALGPRLHAAEPLTISYFGFDTTRPPFDDARVRLAFSLALDRERLVPLSEGAGAQAAASLVPPAIWPDGFTPEPASDPDRARELLDEAGYADPAELGAIVVNGNGLFVDPAVAVWREELGVEIERRDDGLRQLPRAARHEAAAAVHRQLDRRLRLAARALRAAARARRAEQLRRLARRRLRRPAGCRGGGPEDEVGAAY